MNRVKFLDCTLRDGGYVNHWQFGADTMKDMLARLTAAGLDIIECGFLTDLPSTKDQSLFHSPKDLDPLLPDGDHTLYVAMIAIGEKEMNPTALPDKKDTKLGGIRLTFHPDGRSGKGVLLRRNDPAKGVPAVYAARGHRRVFRRRPDPPD